MSDQKQKFAERAAASFMTLSVNVRRWEGVAKLNEGALKAAKDAGANPETFRGYVSLLGQHHNDLKAVCGAYRRIYNFMDERCIKVDRGQWLCPVALVPAVLKDLTLLISKADAKRDQFIGEYARLVSIAQSEDMGDWAGEVSAKYPHPEDVQERFGADVRPPRPLPVADMSRLNLPADLAAKLADDQAAMLDEQLENAQQSVIDAVSNSLNKVLAQLNDGKRFHQSLIDNLRRDAEMLREMTKGYDADPRLLAIAKKIDSEVLNVDNVEQWRYDSDTSVRTTAGLNARIAARKAATSLKSVTTAPQASKVKLGGIVGKKFAAKNAA